MIILATVGGLLNKLPYGFIVPAMLLVSGLLLLVNPQPRND